MHTITFTEDALLRLKEWKAADARMLAKIVTLITEIAASPFTGLGKPEPLKHDLKGK